MPDYDPAAPPAADTPDSDHRWTGASGAAGLAAGARSSFVVVANRLPVDRVESADGDPCWRRSPGGLVTALAPVMRDHHGAWVGWVGSPDEELEPFDADGFHLVPVDLSAAEVRDYYEGFSNATLWPLYHDVIAPPAYDRRWWDAYRRVNRRFVDAAAAVAAEGATVWIHDYQLQLAPAMLRAQRPDLRIGFFLHIPFPPRELFARLPWRRQIVEGLLGADLVGFQRPGAASNFLRLCRAVPGAHVHRDTVFLPRGRKVTAGAFPISIDFAEIDDAAQQPETQKRAAELRAELGNPRYVLLGADRLDYTKGIGERIRAFGELLDEGALTPDDAVFVQVAMPSRERVEEYQRLRDDVELQVGRLNGTHGRIGHAPVHYIHNTVPHEQMVSLYRAADVMVVTPLRDGMNLVAKEYVAARHDRSGVLVLSEFAGAADELRSALSVNPYDIDGMKQALLDAVRMPLPEQRRRIGLMRRYLREHDVSRWARDYLDALAGKPTRLG